MKGFEDERRKANLTKRADQNKWRRRRRRREIRNESSNKPKFSSKSIIRFVFAFDRCYRRLPECLALDTEIRDRWTNCRHTLRPHAAKFLFDCKSCRFRAHCRTNSRKWCPAWWTQKTESARFWCPLRSPTWVYHLQRDLYGSFSFGTKIKNINDHHHHHHYFHNNNNVKAKLERKKNGGRPMSNSFPFDRFDRKWCLTS